MFDSKFVGLLFVIFLCPVHSLELSRSYLETLLPRVEEAKRIKLYDTSISAIQENAFEGLYMLEELDVSALRIDSLDANSFNDLVSLKRLNLQLNKLSHLPKNVINGFRLVGLESLDLSFNSIGNVSEIFLHLYSLEKLSLFENQLSHIDAGVFDQITGLQRLDLGNLA